MPPLRVFATRNQDAHLGASVAGQLVRQFQRGTRNPAIWALDDVERELGQAKLLPCFGEQIGFPCVEVEVDCAHVVAAERSGVLHCSRCGCIEFVNEHHNGMAMHRGCLGCRFRISLQLDVFALVRLVQAH